jgi:prevent-host-death family protein
MPDVGVRELKIRASEIVRDVREHRARYVITYRGRPVGVLLPLEEAPQAGALAGGQPGTTIWEELSALGEEIGRGWRSPLTSAELLSQMRR